MAQLPIQHQPTVDKIYKYYVDKNIEWRRPHLGASQIGDDCLRKLWYSFRHCSSPNFIGRMHRLFNTGKIEEERIINDLRNIGVCVYDRDPSDGKQISYKEEGCPHYSGSVDGIAQGFEESKSWHVLEIKSSSSKLFAQIKKHGCEKSKPLHYSQIQAYCRWAGLDRAFYFVVNKDTDEIYSERIYLDKNYAEGLANKAKRVVYSDAPLEKLGDSESSFCCKFCDHSDLCWNKKLPLVSCRSCAFSTPEVDGTWTCKGEKVLSEFEQKAGCAGHVFIPAFVSLEQTDADPEKGTISYGDIINGPGHIESKDLEKEILKRSR